MYRSFEEALEAKDSMFSMDGIGRMFVENLVPKHRSR